jgi:hypothetical protein
MTHALRRFVCRRRERRKDAPVPKNTLTLLFDGGERLPGRHGKTVIRNETQGLLVTGRKPG